MSVWERLMRLGNICGCHQRADRSFFCRNRQFPLCARCTGLLLGYILSPVLRFWYKPKLIVCIIFMLIMLADWILQYRRILCSTNVRRLITGTLCGYGLMNIVFSAAKLLVSAM